MSEFSSLEAHGFEDTSSPLPGTDTSRRIYHTAPQVETEGSPLSRGCASLAETNEDKSFSGGG